MHPNEIALAPGVTAELLNEAVALDFTIGGGTKHRDALAEQLKRQLMDRAPEQTAEKRIKR
jgi:6,7-dimethyl-8-ribityllumazine synthase